MASNYNNYFFQVKAEEFAHDEYIFGLNTSTGSFFFAGAKETWFPTTGTIPSQGVRVYDSFVFSPIHHGHFFDVLESPPERYLFSRTTRTTPPVTVNLASSSYRLSSNMDPNSRIFIRYLDEVPQEEPLAIAEIFVTSF